MKRPISLASTASYQIGLIEGLADAVKLGTGSSGHDKVLGPVDAADQIHGADERLVALGPAQASNDRFGKVGTKATGAARER